MSRPNILFIIADDMGYGDFSCFNDGRSQTPCLDGLASEGVCLTQHYTGSTLCAPSRASLLTGRYPHRTGAIDTLEVRGLDRISLREKTVGDYFRAAGYATGYVGKWHNGAIDPRYHPNARGFDEFVGFRGGWWDYYDWTLDCNGAFRKSDGRYLTDTFTDEAIGFLKRHQSEPFFLHLAYNAPHAPFQVPEEDVRPFTESGRFNEHTCNVYGMIRRMDKGIARVLEELDRLGLARNTVVFFTSDNGPAIGSEARERFNCNFRGYKGLMYEGGIRLPMIIRWPDGLPRGVQCDSTIHFNDWLPTQLAMAGIETEPHLPFDGVNVLPCLRGEEWKLNPKRFWQWNRYTPLVTSNAAMRDGDWKLVRPRIDSTCVVSEEDRVMDGQAKKSPSAFSDICRDPEPPRDVPPPPPAQLFNIAEDPQESNDLAKAEPDRARRMLRELETWFEEVDAERALALRAEG